MYNKKDFWGWLFGALGILFVVHILFKIHPSISWFSAEWSAGDLITFIGTVTLGFVSYVQTKKATEMAKLADDMNKEFLKLQAREYLPVIECDKETFCGVFKDESFLFITKPTTTICTTVTTPSDKDEDPFLGYSLTLLCQDDFDLQNNEHITYEMHLQYSGKYNIKDFSISNVSFYYNESLIMKWEINERFGVSLSKEEEFILFLRIIDNKKSSILKNISSANILKIDIDMLCFDGSKYTERMNITKHLVTEYVPSLKRKDVELMISAGYDVE